MGYPACIFLWEMYLNGSSIEVAWKIRYFYFFTTVFKIEFIGGINWDALLSVSHRIFVAFINIILRNGSNVFQKIN